MEIKDFGEATEAEVAEWYEAVFKRDAKGSKVAPTFLVSYRGHW